MVGNPWFAAALIVAMCVVPVSASPAVTTNVNTQGLNASGNTADSHHAERHRHSIINANGQTAGYFHGTLTAKGTDDTSNIQVWFEYGDYNGIWFNYG